MKNSLFKRSDQDPKTYFLQTNFIIFLKPCTFKLFLVVHKYNVLSPVPFSIQKLF